MDPLLVTASPVPESMSNVTPDNHYLDPINCYNGKDKNLCIRSAYIAVVFIYLFIYNASHIDHSMLSFKF